MESLILYGGTFDPVHNGHLRIARAASLALNADVIFIPNANPPGKKPIACFSDRLEMLKDALKEDVKCLADLVQLENYEDLSAGMNAYASAFPKLAAARKADAEKYGEEYHEDDED